MRAMQKVEGSRPVVRLKKSPVNRGFFYAHRSSLHEDVPVAVEFRDGGPSMMG